MHARLIWGGGGGGGIIRGVTQELRKDGLICGGPVREGTSRRRNTV